MLLILISNKHVGIKAKADQYEAHEVLPPPNTTTYDKIVSPFWEQSQNPLFLDSCTNVVPQLIYGIYFLPKKSMNFQH